MRLGVREYLTSEGRSPFREWLDALEVPARARVQARILRFELGNLGDHKSVGAGVWEARLTFGSGLRIYFGRAGPQIVLLLLGGDKHSQKKDIRLAKRYWAEFLEATRHDKTQ